MSIIQIDLEMFILEQFVLQGMILCIVAKMLSQQVIWKRIIAGAVMGAVYGLAGAFIELSRPMFMVMNSLAGCIILLLAFRVESVGQLVQLNMVFYAVSLMLGGAVYCLSAVPGKMEVLSGAMLGGVFLWTMGRIFIRQLRLKSCLGKLWVCNGTRMVELTGFLDTGNSLYTSDGLPVIITEQQVLRGLFDKQNEQLEFNRKLNAGNELTEYWNGKYCCVLCGVVNGSQPIVCFRPDKVYIKLPGRPKRAVKAAIGLVARPLSQQRQYRALLHQEQAV